MKALPIFARTFLLLLGALLVALALGIALLLTMPPRRPADIPLSEVVALLSSELPSTNGRLTVSDSSERPACPEGHRQDPFMRMRLARWLGVPEDQVSYCNGMRMPGLGPGSAFHQRPAGPDRAAVFEPAAAGEAGTGPAVPPAARRPPPMRDAMPPGDDGFPANAPLFGNFVAATRKADGHWRSVVHRMPGPLPSVARQVGLLFLCGAVAMLPLAWWFSRALSAPISRFAQAADRLGSHPGAAPLDRSGPAELARAADSFNTMQARINRLLDERTRTIGAIAHDLRTPLARLSFRLQALPAEARDKASADIDEMSRMITAALDFLHGQSQPGPRDRLDFASLVESAVGDLADTGQDVMLTAAEPAVLLGDPLALRRAVSNLIDNALKYAGSARLQLYRDNGNVVLEVDDDGPGIDPARENELFLPFARGDESRNRDTGGIGLGLSVAHGVVLDHGGSLRLHNRSEGGLRALMTLPCLPADQGALA
ncbi:HAMP domain-containing sensor histidine kinase [uncultured Stenotrophomonas sp.]|uniref:ATP-binding protein n=1 Tax=uncultured Stenotrophomonas sp. TaxID=165438 RepID=UPI0025D2FAE0|nr:HAMP domain-containing sensor histidine kinase [uncultured Stenotrophomonas sp.]